MAQHTPRQPIEQQVDDDPGQRQQEQRREEARDREPVAGFENAESEPRLGPARAGDELGNDSANQCQAAADSEAREEVGQGGRQS